MSERIQGHPKRNWTTEQLTALEWMLDKGMPDAAIGKALGRSATAVQVMRKRSRLPSRTERNYTCRKLGSLLGVDGKAVAWWIRNRWLRGRQGQRRGRNRQWVVTEDALMEFLENRAYWHLWDPARLADRDLREWALEQRSEQFLTLAEVARRFWVVESTVGSWLDRGELPFVRRGRGNRLVPESSLRGWVPPGQRSKKGMVQRPWTEFEDAVIRRGRANGESYAAIAASMDRSPSAVASRLRRLGGAGAVQMMADEWRAVDLGETA